MELQCTKCNKNIDVFLCPDCQTKSISRFQSFISKTVTILKDYIYPIFVSLFVMWVGGKYDTPPVTPLFEPNIIYNSGSTSKIDGPFKLDFTEDTTPWVTVAFQNSGETFDENLRFSINFPIDNTISTMTYEYNPIAIKSNITETKSLKTSFTEIFNVFPAKCSAQYRFTMSKCISNIKEIQCILVSKTRNWSENIKIQPNSKKTTWVPFSSVAYGEEISSFTNYSCSTTSPTFIAPNTPRSGILFGGYDPIVLTNGLFVLLQQKKVLNTSEAETIQQIVNSTKDGVLLSGINVLKFCEVIINVLYNKRIINRDQADYIVFKSQTSGGILIGGYNPIILHVEILNSLLKANIITIEEGQHLIDNAKQ